MTSTQGRVNCAKPGARIPLLVLTSFGKTPSHGASKHDHVTSPRQRTPAKATRADPSKALVPQGQPSCRSWNPTVTTECAGANQLEGGGTTGRGGPPCLRCPGPSPTHQPASVSGPGQAPAQNRPGELGPTRRPAGLPNSIGGGCSERPSSGLVGQKHTDSTLSEITAVNLFIPSLNGHL